MFPSQNHPMAMTDDPNASNHYDNTPRPPWTIPQRENSALGPSVMPHALVSYTPILTIRVARHTLPNCLSLYFESYPNVHLFPRVHIKKHTRTVQIKFRHSSFHRGLVPEGVMREMGGPVPEQYVTTTTRHEFELPEGFSAEDWCWRRFRAGNGPGEGGSGGTHVLEVTFWEEGWEDVEEGGSSMLDQPVEDKGKGTEL